MTATRRGILAAYGLLLAVLCVAWVPRSLQSPRGDKQAGHAPLWLLQTPPKQFVAYSRASESARTGDIFDRLNLPQAPPGYIPPHRYSFAKLDRGHLALEIVALTALCGVALLLTVRRREGETHMTLQEGRSNEKDGGGRMEVLIGPSSTEGMVSRVVSDKEGWRTETWSEGRWIAGGLTLGTVLISPLADSVEMDAAGVPASDRTVGSISREISSGVKSPAALEYEAFFLRKWGRDAEADKREARAQAIRAKHAEENPPK